MKGPILKNNLIKLKCRKVEMFRTSLGTDLSKLLRRCFICFVKKQTPLPSEESLPVIISQRLPFVQVVKAGCYQKLFLKKKIQELPAWPKVGVADRCCSSTGGQEVTGVTPVKPLGLVSVP